MYTSIDLNNGLRIVNFSSPHPFNFVTGEILPACEKEWVKKMSLDIVETNSNSAYSMMIGRRESNPVQISDIHIKVNVPKMIIDALDELNEDANVDIVLVPFMLLQALKDGGWPHRKCRAIRVADRISKEIYSNKFCV